MLSLFSHENRYKIDFLIYKWLYNTLYKSVLFCVSLTIGVWISFFSRPGRRERVKILLKFLGTTPKIIFSAGVNYFHIHIQT